jgi:hypothetical protein
MEVMILVPVEVEVVAVVRMPAIVEMYDGFPLFSRGTEEMSGTMVGAACVFLGRDTILMPVWQDSCRLR